MRPKNIILMTICLVFLLSCDNTKTTTKVVSNQGFSSKKGKRMFLAGKKVSQNIPLLDANVPENLHTATFALG